MSHNADRMHDETSEFDTTLPEIQLPTCYPLPAEEEVMIGVGRYVRRVVSGDGNKTNATIYTTFEPVANEPVSDESPVIKPVPTTPNRIFLVLWLE